MAYQAGSGGRTAAEPQRNVLGGEIAPCSVEPVTGFFRDGCCNTSPEDAGSHTVCAVMTASFWRFRKRAATICRRRCREFQLSRLEARRPLVPVRAALAGGVRGRCTAPKVVLAATHEGALAYCATSPT